MEGKDTTPSSNDAAITPDPTSTSESSLPISESDPSLPPPNHNVIHLLMQLEVPVSHPPPNFPDFSIDGDSPRVSKQPPSVKPLDLPAPQPPSALSAGAAFFTALRSTVDNLTSFIYGGTVATHSVVEAIESTAKTVTGSSWTSQVAGFQNILFDNFAPVALGLTALNILGATGSVLHRTLINGKWSDGRNFDDLLTIASNSTLFSIAHQAYQSHQLMSLGSTAIGYICDGFALVALTHFITTLRRYDQASIILDEANVASSTSRYKEYAEEQCAKAKSDFILATINLIGWGSLALAHLPFFAASAPALLAIGGTALALRGFYVISSTVMKCCSVGGPANFFKQQRKLANTNEAVLDERQTPTTPKITSQQTQN